MINSLKSLIRRFTKIRLLKFGDKLLRFDRIHLLRLWLLQAFLKILWNSQENACATSLKKRLWHMYFALNFEKFIRIPFLYRTPPVVASAHQIKTAKFYELTFYLLHHCSNFSKVYNRQIRKVLLAFFDQIVFKRFPCVFLLSVHLYLNC